jgi:hypothetical protein
MGVPKTCSNAALCTIALQDAKTPLITSRTPTVDAGQEIATPNAFSIVLASSNMAAYTAATFSAYLELIQPAPAVNAQLNKFPRFAADSVSTSDTAYTVAFTNVPAGSYKLYLQVSGAGYA